MDRDMNVDSTMSKDTREDMDPRMDEAMDQPAMDELPVGEDTHASMAHPMGSDMDDTMSMHTNKQRKWGWFRRKSRRA